MAKLVPHKCVDRFPLGITSEVVVEYLGQPNIAENIGSHLYWDYQSECLSFEFNEKNQLIVIEAYSPEITLWGTNIKGQSQEFVTNFLQKNGYRELETRAMENNANIWLISSELGLSFDFEYDKLWLVEVRKE